MKILDCKGFWLPTCSLEFPLVCRNAARSLQNHHGIHHFRYIANVNHSVAMTMCSRKHGSLVLAGQKICNYIVIILIKRCYSNMHLINSMNVLICHIHCMHRLVCQCLSRLACLMKLYVVHVESFDIPYRLRLTGKPAFESTSCSTKDVSATTH